MDSKSHSKRPQKRKDSTSRSKKNASQHQSSHHVMSSPAQENYSVNQNFHQSTTQVWINPHRQGYITGVAPYDTFASQENYYVNSSAKTTSVQACGYNSEAGDITNRDHQGYHPTFTPTRTNAFTQYNPDTDNHAANPKGQEPTWLQTEATEEKRTRKDLDLRGLSIQETADAYPISQSVMEGEMEDELDMF
ncbi:hypothetical protein HYFRA_00011996 [Hymenoscyphus fraxineus]|uniref:Uncharacterized protein n=1 Tax=Hymenoscyphus fraxineus TaxID=746836 RepID=A0A9N9PV63_9HELO|nr:hypothetical protein HYFRA_00011996 [Hymenoscyphus fraxineus]